MQENHTIFRLKSEINNDFSNNVGEFVQGIIALVLYLAVFFGTVYLGHAVIAILFLYIVAMRFTVNLKTADAVELAERCEAAALRRADIALDCLAELKTEYTTHPNHKGYGWSLTRIDYAIRDMQNVKNPRQGKEGN
jgi:hypothetical protein